MADLALINGYDIRDRKLADAQVDTSVGSNDHVIVETATGSYIKIGKENLTEAIRQVLGGILNGIDKGTSVSNIAVMDSNHDLGMTSAYNLASVLGDALYPRVPQILVDEIEHYYFIDFDRLTFRLDYGNGNFQLYYRNHLNEFKARVFNFV